MCGSLLAALPLISLFDLFPPVNARDHQVISMFRSQTCNCLNNFLEKSALKQKCSDLLLFCHRSGQGIPEGHIKHLVH